ncbi:LysO family transporter [uncultured Bacteroides sp.]|uniref:LysO family transporter n=1 Tax=uncultured Bacteroides sp. TaxID=162156 RepID=UPI00261F8A96|nr:LysO family transporter [uncultured Bacteroides sp.]
MFVLTIIALMLGGVGVGYLLRRRNTRPVGRIITILIWLLLFLLGTEVGGNPDIINGLGTLGVEAALITLFGVVGSCLAARFLWNYICRKGGSDQS